MFFALLIVSAAVIVLRLYFRGGQCQSNASMMGKTVVITGCNSGIGKETASELCSRGARVVMACRDMDKMNDAANDIMESSRGNGSVATYQVDLSEFDSVRKCAEEILKKEEKIDVLINNAGIKAGPFAKNSDGLEMHMATNHYGHFLLTNLLLDKMKSSNPTEPSRIVVVSSRLHSWATMNNLKDLNWDRRTYDAHKAYAQSKLANIMFARELARRTRSSNVNVYAVHPGIVNTDLEGSSGLLSFLQAPIGAFFQKTARDGAQTAIDCAVNPNLADHSGRYYADCQEKLPSEEAQNDVLGRRFWELSEQVVAL